MKNNPQPQDRISESFRSSLILDPAKDHWLEDHAPTYVIPALPFTVMVKLIMDAANSRFPHLKVVKLEEMRVTNWLSFPDGRKEIQIQSEVMEKGEPGDVEVRVSLLQYREARTKELSRFEPFCSGRVILDTTYPDSALKPDIMMEKAATTETSGSEFYGGERMFCGPSFQLVDKIFSSPSEKTVSFSKTRPDRDLPDTLRMPFSEKAVSFLKTRPDRDLPVELRIPFLIDAATQTVIQMQYDQTTTKDFRVPAGAGHSIINAIFYDDCPTADRVRCEVEFVGFHTGERFPKFVIRLFSGESADAKLWAEILFVAILFQGGKLWERVPEGCRRTFLQERKPIRGVGLSDFANAFDCSVTLQDIKKSDWLPGTVAAVYLDSKEEWTQYRSREPQEAREWLALQVAAKDLMAQMLWVHPSSVNITSDTGDRLIALSEHCPFNPRVLTWSRDGNRFRVVTDGKEMEPLERFKIVNNYWRQNFGADNTPVEKLTNAIADRFVSMTYIVDPKEMEALYGTPCLYLANHQTYLEDFLFVIGLYALGGCPATALAKQAHRARWPGLFSKLIQQYPNSMLPPKTEYLDRDSPEELIRVIKRIEELVTSEGKSVLINVEGTRARSARQKVEKLSNIWGDIAIRSGRPIVPVRFLGGLPLEATGRQYEFPVGYGRQTYCIGRPIMPKKLEAIPYAERPRYLRGAINSLGDAVMERPSSTDDGFAAKLKTFMEYTGTDEAPAVLYNALACSNYAPKIERRLGDHQFEDLTDALIAAGEIGVTLKQATALILPETPEGLWMREFAQWAFGARGPRVCTSRSIPSDAAVKVFAGV